MTEQEIKSLRAGDGVVGIRTGNRAVVRYFEDGLPGIEYTSYPRNGDMGLLTPIHWEAFRRETFIEFLTRPDGMGKTSWWAVALPNIGLLLIALKYGDLWYWPVGTAVVFNVVMVYMAWRNYTHKTV
jgi:hypothetical protein